MKIEYDVELYKKIANFRTNEIIQVSNRKGKRSNIHITNITKLSWHELQLLISDGEDRFSKMVLLHEKYSNKNESLGSFCNGQPLTENESSEINNYIEIYNSNNFTSHHEANNFITENNLWNNFKTIRSLNDHGEHKEIEGIQPKYFEIVCGILKITGEHGLPLDQYRKY